MPLKRLPEPFPAPSACTTFNAFIASPAVRDTAERISMDMLARVKCTDISPEDIHPQIERIFAMVGESPKSVASRDSTRLGPYRSELDGMLGADFYKKTLPGIAGSLEGLTWEDYYFVRRLRLDFESAMAKNPDFARQADRYVRAYAGKAIKTNSQITPNTLNTFLPELTVRDARINYSAFFDALERAVRNHIYLNPVYNVVEWSHARIPEPNEQEKITLRRQLERMGFVILDGFGHEPDAPGHETTLHETAIKKSGTFPHEMVHTRLAPGSEAAKSDTAIAQVVGMHLVWLGHKLSTDPRIVKVRQMDRERRMTEMPVVDEIGIARVDPDGAKPYLVYSVNKSGMGAGAAEPEKTFDSRDFPSYSRLRGIVPNPDDKQLFAIENAEWAAIDFGLAYHAPDGQIYIATFNDTERTLWDIVKMVKPGPLALTIGAIRELATSMLEKLLATIYHVESASL